LVPVSAERWRQAQQWELDFWLRAEQRQGWKRLVYPVLRPLLAALDSHSVVGDDDNVWWSEQFDHYAFLPRDLGEYIELGCGPYTNTRLILRQRRASRVVCSDPLANEYLGFRDRWLSRAQRSGVVEVDAHPIEETPFPPESFDTVVVINVLDHVRDVAQCLRNALSILRPGGWFVLGQDLAKPDTVHQVEYGWYEQGHPHRVVMRDIESHFEPLEKRVERVVEPRDPRVQASVLAFAGVKRSQR
jgi:SAM-dependent methyltransferase